MFNIILVLLGVFLSLDAIILVLISNVHIGLIITLVLGVLFILYGALPERYTDKISPLLKRLFWGCIAIAVLMCGFVMLYGVSDDALYNEDAIIVLGCGIHGDRISVNLKHRLDAALEYCGKNRDALIVVSGGQGWQEDITEAEAMERYLLSQGFEQNRIIKEERSTNTYENFKYSKELLEEHLGAEFKVAYSTNEYHIFRAGRLARLNGFDEVTHVHANTQWFSVIPVCFRECLGIMKFIFFRQ